jgi:hypothetical protein
VSNAPAGTRKRRRRVGTSRERVRAESTSFFKKKYKTKKKSE